MLDRFEDSERLLLQCLEGKGNKNRKKVYLFLSIPYMDLSVAVIQLGHSRPPKMYVYLRLACPFLWPELEQ